MDKNEKKFLKESLRETKYKTLLQQRDILKYFLESYIKSILIFGISSEVTKETLRIYKELKEIQDKEYEIHEFLKRNALKIDEIATAELLNRLDELNDKTIEYYYEALDDMITACDLKNETYIKHRKKNFETLNETNAYKIAAGSLLITYEDLKQMLEFEEEFWKYIEQRIVFRNSNTNSKFTIDIKLDENNNTKDFTLVLPSIVDIFSVKKCIELISYAYVLYTYIGREIDDENILNMPEEEKINEYILTKFK